MYLITGLGNPGIKYEKTRHNVGFDVIGEIIDKYNLKLKNYPKFQSYIAETQLSNEKIILAMPLTYMNNSGLAVSRLSNFYKLPPENIIVIHDDIDLPFGKMRISFSSSAGGHNGVSSIIESLGTKKFIRVRVGIANEILNSQKIPAEKFVLQKFSIDETKSLSNKMPKYAEAVELIVKEGYEKAMALFN